MGRQVQAFIDFDGDLWLRNFGALKGYYVMNQDGGIFHVPEEHCEDALLDATQVYYVGDSVIITFNGV